MKCSHYLVLAHLKKTNDDNLLITFFCIISVPIVSYRNLPFVQKLHGSDCSCTVQHCAALHPGTDICPSLPPHWHPPTHCTLHTTHYTLHTPQYTLQSAHCTRQTSHWILNPHHCTLHHEHCTWHTARGTLQNTPCTLHNSYCTLRNAHCYKL